MQTSPFPGKKWASKGANPAHRLKPLQENEGAEAQKQKCCQPPAWQRDSWPFVLSDDLGKSVRSENYKREKTWCPRLASAGFRSSAVNWKWKYGHESWKPKWARASKHKTSTLKGAKGGNAGLVCVTSGKSYIDRWAPLASMEAIQPGPELQAN